MRDVLLAACLSLTGCAWNQVLAWEPHSTISNPQRIARAAVMIGPGDVGAVREAGGHPLGALTMKGDGGVARLHAAAAVEAAKRGGTHYFVKRADSAVSTGPYGMVTEVEPQITYGVIRVPLGEWSALPSELMPAEVTAKK